MFDILSMMNNYEERKVDRYEDGEIVIDTASELPDNEYFGVEITTVFPKKEA